MNRPDGTDDPHSDGSGGSSAWCDARRAATSPPPWGAPPSKQRPCDFSVDGRGLRARPSRLLGLFQHRPPKRRRRGEGTKTRHPAPPSPAVEASDLNRTSPPRGDDEARGHHEHDTAQASRAGRGGGPVRGADRGGGQVHPAMELYEALGDKIRGLGFTVDTLLERNALKRSAERDEDDYEVEEDDDEDDDKEKGRPRHLKKHRGETKSYLADEKDAKIDELEDLVNVLRDHVLERELADKDATIREQAKQLGKLRADLKTAIDELRAVRHGRHTVEDRSRPTEATTESTPQHPSDRDVRSRTPGRAAPVKKGRHLPLTSTPPPPPVGTSAPRMLDRPIRPSDPGTASHEFLKQPVTRAMDQVMRQGVKAFLAFQQGKGRKGRKYTPGERLYYVCQACSDCRNDPTKATCYSIEASACSNYPRHCPGFLAYDVRLPHKLRYYLQAHLKKKRAKPGVVVADPPAIQAPATGPRSPPSSSVTWRGSRPQDPTSGPIAAAGSFRITHDLLAANRRKSRRRPAAECTWISRRRRRHCSPRRSGGT